MSHILQALVNLFRPTKDSAQTTIEASLDFTHLYRPLNTFGEEFYSNLCKTALWTHFIVSRIIDSSNVNYSTVLRQTNPIYLGRLFYDFSCEDSPAPPGVSFDYHYILQEALQLRDIHFHDAKFDLKGRILVFEIDITTYDGAPAANSAGFVDEADIPPIDTWFYITKKHLYCWIPTMFIPIMQDAVDVEIFGSYEWLQDANPDLNKQILEEVKRRLTPGL